MVAALSVAGTAGAQTAEVAPPFVTTPPEVVERMLALAETRGDDVVMDLGSGDGRIVIAAAKQYGARGIGVELDPKLVAAARENAQAAGVAQQTRFLNGDVLKADLSGASVVTAYLLPWLMDALQPKFLAELAPGTRIVSHAFAMSGWEPDATREFPLSGEHAGRTATLYFWVVPAEVRGEWYAAQPEGEWRLEIRQNFQQIEVEGAVGDVPLRTSGAVLRGTHIGWQGEGEGEGGTGRFEGRVLTFQIVGTLTANGASRSIVFARRP
ncbi:MAG: hypothetical protein AMJ64_13135 [Betaproteobacteria bacterium SG8_39]|nr:MAG: hypothetical protein AMJ64_13135 [Betaproteobacteria bacterium SG8_39]